MGKLCSTGKCKRNQRGKEECRLLVKLETISLRRLIRMWISMWEKGVTGNWKYLLPFSCTEILFPGQHPGSQGQPNQMIFLCSFSWFNFCRTLTLSQSNSKGLCFQSRFPANSCLHIFKIKVDSYAAKCTGTKSRMTPISEKQQYIQRASLPR